MIAVKRELRFGIAMLLAAQIVLALGAIGLLSRLAPAIDRILQENVRSIEAAERMLVVLALHEKGKRLDDEFHAALERAQSNVTEPEEAPILAKIELSAAALVAGDALAYEPTVEAIEELVVVNREAMRQTRDRASRLSEAGAWAAVLLAVVVFSVGVVIAILVERRIVEPLQEVFAVAHAAKKGDPYRRCQYRQAPEEMRELMSILNELLDERFSVERNDHDDENADTEIPGSS